MFPFWFLGRKKAKPFGPWEKTTTASTGQPARDTRHYLADSPYMLPKDEEEDHRINLQHHALYNALGNHYIAPISSTLRTILDVGTGTGIWADQMARLFPHTVVVGLDIALSSFKGSPSENCFLCQGNVLTGLPFPDAFFSFTHQRLLVAAIPAKEWPGVIRELIRVTRPGGWVELIEIDNRMENAGPATAKAQKFMEEISASFGFHWEVVRNLGDILKQEGLQHVEVQPIPIPVGDWSGRVGKMMKIDLLAATNALRGRYCSHAGITGEEFDQMVQAMAQEWEVCQSSCLFFAAYGKRAQT
jgi:ubiquinone/menaquinone biosynthesis C-methylase UbiE